MSWPLRQRLRRLLRAERGMRPGVGRRLEVALVFPNLYHLAMSNLGFQTVYRILNECPDTRCERAFLPYPEERQLLAQSGSGPLTLESQRPLRQFDWVAFSVSFENDYAGLLEVLKLSGIPLRSAQRTAEDPLIVVGGAAPSLNPEPLSPFADLMVIGEAEGVLERLVELWEPAGNRERFLERAAELPGVYVPRLGGPVRRAWARDVAQRPAHSVIITPEAEFSNAFLLEVGRGCPWGCRFCAAAFLYRPPRASPLEALVEPLERGLREAETVGLVGVDLGGHPQLEDLLEFVLQRGGRVSLPSLRPQLVSEQVLNAIRRSGQRTLSLAVEAASERLRRLLNKPLREEELEEVLAACFRRGVRTVKLYFMIGLPGEEPADVERIARLVRRLGGKGGSVTVSASVFVPKPGTPLQWCPFVGEEEAKARLRLLRRALGGVPCSAEVPKWSQVQALLARGDRRVADLLELAHRVGWRAAMRRWDGDPHRYLGAWDPTEPLPWGVVTGGASPEFLRGEYERALRGELSDPCHPGCARCGLCAGG